MKAKRDPDAARRMLDSVKLLLRAGDTLSSAVDYLGLSWHGERENIEARAILVAAQAEVLQDAKLVLASLTGWVQ